MADLKNLEEKKKLTLRPQSWGPSDFFHVTKMDFVIKILCNDTSPHSYPLNQRFYCQQEKREEASCWPQNWTNTETLTPTLKNIFQLCILETPPLPPPLSTSACNKEHILSSVFTTLKSICYSELDKQGLPGKNKKTNLLLKVIITNNLIRFHAVAYLCICDSQLRLDHSYWFYL